MGLDPFSGGRPASQFVPHLRQRVLVVILLHLDEHGGPTGFGDAGHEIKLAELLHGGLNLVGDLFGNFHRRCTRVVRENLRALDGEPGILESPQPTLRPDSAADHEDRHYQRDGLVAYRSLGDAHWLTVLLTNRRRALGPRLHPRSRGVCSADYTPSSVSCNRDSQSSNASFNVFRAFAQNRSGIAKWTRPSLLAPSFASTPCSGSAPWIADPREVV